MFKQFKEFAMKGNVVDMAVGIIIGGAFTGVVNALVSQVMMPPLGLLTGGIDFTNFFLILKDGTLAPPYATLADAKAAGAVTLNLGLFINSLVSFLLMALAVFFLVRAINALRKLQEEAPAPAPAPTTKTCPYCMSQIPLGATRCPACTSQLGK